MARLLCMLVAFSLIEYHRLCIALEGGTMGVIAEPQNQIWSLFYYLSRSACARTFKMKVRIPPCIEIFSILRPRSSAINGLEFYWLCALLKILVDKVWMHSFSMVSHSVLRQIHGRFRALYIVREDCEATKYIMLVPLLSPVQYRWSRDHNCHNNSNQERALEEWANLLLLLIVDKVP